MNDKQQIIFDALSDYDQSLRRWVVFTRLSLWAVLVACIALLTTVVGSSLLFTAAAAIAGVIYLLVEKKPRITLEATTTFVEDYITNGGSFYCHENGNISLVIKDSAGGSPIWMEQKKLTLSRKVLSRIREEFNSNGYRTLPFDILLNS
jgi:hypothetical protein